MLATRRPLIVLIALIGLFVAVLVAVFTSGRPLAQDGLTAQQSLGASLFRTRCSSCHATTSEMKIGPGLAGLFAPGGPTLPDGVDYGGRLPNGAEISDENVAAFIRVGGKGQIGNMPGFELTDQEIDALISYLKTLGT